MGVREVGGYKMFSLSLLEGRHYTSQMFSSAEVKPRESKPRKRMKNYAWIKNPFQRGTEKGED